MSAQPSPFDLQTLRRLIRAIKDLLTSEVRHKAIGLLIFLLAFALSINGLNVVSSYVGRDFMTAIAHREMAEFVRQAILYIGLFVVMTAVALVRKKGNRVILVAGGAVFTAALFFSYSRSSLVNAGIAIAALLWMERKQKAVRRMTITSAAALAVTLSLIHI